MWQRNHKTEDSRTFTSWTNLAILNIENCILINLQKQLKSIVGTYAEEEQVWMLTQFSFLQFRKD
jgi:hypothetical protein